MQRARRRHGGAVSRFKNRFAASRAKGKTFERAVATAYRERWPDRVVRRALQAEKAHEPDVVVEGLPLWTECCCADSRSALSKLMQAERDCLHRLHELCPVVVWRKTGAKTTQVTMRLATLASTLGSAPPPHRASGLPVTLDFREWLAEVTL